VPHRTQYARILVVDDEPNARDALRAFLHERGFIVDSASDGQSAIEQTALFKPDVVLTDLHMAGLDGIQLCGALRERDPELPVVLMTAHDDAPSIIRGLRAGIDDYLTKPLDIELVLCSVRRVIGVHAARIEREHARHRSELLAEARAAATRYEDILAVVAHDLRSPLNVIQLAAELLVEGNEISGDNRQLVESITRSLAQSHQIIENLLDEARLHGAGITLEHRSHRVEELLDDVADLRPLALRRGIMLDVRPGPAQATLSCDRAKIGQVLANLVGNAIKFSPKGSTVTVWAEETAGVTRLAVRDEGPGIGAEAQQHLFERFWQDAGSRTSGIGLGLYIAKGIVDAHGGEIRVASERGAGSTFFVSLPADRPAKNLTEPSRQRSQTTAQPMQHACAESE